MRKLDTNLFITKAKEKYGNKYSYKKVNYEDSKTKIIVTCKKHGDFSVKPANFLYGSGCPKCGIELSKTQRIGLPHKQSHLYFGVGNRGDYLINTRGERLHSFDIWYKMLARCYSCKKEYSTYKDCTVCKEWLFFPTFKKWYDINYVEGYALDKDILLKGNKIYSPQTCCFIPIEVNSLFTKNNIRRGDLPIGVKRKGKHKYEASLSINNNLKYLGSFCTVNEAFNAYKKSKEENIRKIATELYFSNKIAKKVYNALMNYEVEFND